MTIGAATKKYETKAELVKEFGKPHGWEIERSETVNIEQGIGDYQTADDLGEEAYPDPLSRYRFRIEKQTASLEESYYWFLHFVRFDMGFPQFDKIYDIFSASESSAMFGANAQRLGIQQDKASQYLAQIGQLTKTIFPLVRELRIIDERLEMYHNWDKNKSADISLKHLFIQQVEGGTQNPDSVYGLAQRVGFTVLPDIFLNTHVYDKDNIEHAVEKGEVSFLNNTIKVVLKRKLYLYINWKEKTQKELESRRRFNLQYLNQHWNVIKLYMSWIRPYLKTAQRLERHEGFTNSADIVGGFDASKLEVEVLAKKPHNLKANKKLLDEDGKLESKYQIYECMLITCTYKSQPKMTYNPQYQQSNVAHSGVLDVNLRSYVWTLEEINTFKAMRRQEDIAMLKSIDQNVASTFDALGEEFEKYLEEVEDPDVMAKKEELKKEELDKNKKIQELDAQKHKFRKFGLLEPFLEMGSGIGELFGGMVTSEGQNKKKDKVAKAEQEKKEIVKGLKKGATFNAMLFTSLTYHVYKKAHRMLDW